MDEKEPKENGETLRLAIVALFVALNFGLLDYYNGKQWAGITLGSILSVFAKVFVPLGLIVLLIYLTTFGISIMYKKPNLPRLHPFFYDLGIAITALIFFMDGVISFGIWALPVLGNSSLFMYSFLLVAFGGGTIIFYTLLKPWMSKRLVQNPRRE